jgi:uncharacterized membrane protein YdbT with pleckstrin-like domain
MRGRREERVWLEARRHPVVLARAFVKAFVLAPAGVFLLVLGWPATLGGALALALAALLAFRAVWRWERTRLVVTGERLVVVHGTLRRRSAEVQLAQAGPVEVDQSLTGRVLGYGTVVVGDLEVPYVPDPRALSRLVSRLAA